MITAIYGSYMMRIQTHSLIRQENYRNPETKIDERYNMQQTVNVEFRNRNTIHCCYLSVLVLLFLLTACAGIEPHVISEPPFAFENVELFGERPQIISVDEIHQLSPVQEQEFLEYFNAPFRQTTSAHRRLGNYLYHVTEGYAYHYDTYTAEQALELVRGNCLSLVILTTALAKLANVEIGYQLMDSSPVFQLQDTVVFKGTHVSSMLYDPNWGDENAESDTDSNELMRISRRPGIRIDYFSTGTERFIRNITERDYIAMYYRNLAAEAIAKEDYINAYWFTLASMEYEPDSSHAFNTMAVIHRRVGDVAKAEAIFQYGIENLDDKLSLLKNYRILLNEQQRFAEAEEIGREIEWLDDPSPFHWFHAARDSYDDGHYHEAIGFYKKVIDIAPYLHEAYLGLAQSYYQLGQLKAAEKQMQLALEGAHKQSTKSLYQAKLMSLSRNKP